MACFGFSRKPLKNKKPSMIVFLFFLKYCTESYDWEMRGSKICQWQFWLFCNPKKLLMVVFFFNSHIPVIIPKFHIQIHNIFKIHIKKRPYLVFFFSHFFNRNTIVNFDITCQCELILQLTIIRNFLF